MIISEKSWKDYLDRLKATNDKAAELISQYIQSHDISTKEGHTALLEYVNSVVVHYSEGAAEAACEMYDAIAEASGKTVPPAEPALSPTFGDVAKTLNGTMKVMEDPDGIGASCARLVKRTGVDTTMKNALRDGAEWAWVPHGDTCGFCIALGSKGWQRASKNAIKNGHAEHIHANCDCTYAIRFDGKSNVAGYDPDALREQYYSADGATSRERINSLNRAQYAAGKVNNEYYFDGYTDEQKKELQKLHNNAPKEIQDLYAKYGPHLKEADGFIDPKYGAPAYFDLSDGRVHMNRAADAAGNLWELPYQQHEHEYAHNIDYLAGKGNGFYSSQYRNAAGQSFEDVITQDWDKAMRDFYKRTAGDINGAYQSRFNLQLKPGGNIYSTLYSDLTNWRKMNGLSRRDPTYVALKNELDHAAASVEKMRAFYTNHFDVYGDLNYNKTETVKRFTRYIDSNYDKRTKSYLSDMFERYSINAGGPEKPFGFGHGQAYALDQDSLAHETFANMTGSTVVNPESTALIKKFLPNAYNMYLDMLKGMI